MQSIEDFEILDGESYSNFDQSNEREAGLARRLQRLAEDKTGGAAREFFSLHTRFLGDFWFRGTPFTYIEGDDVGLRYVVRGCSRILAQFKVATGYLLIVDCDSTRRVLLACPYVVVRVDC